MVTVGEEPHRGPLIRDAIKIERAARRTGDLEETQNAADQGKGDQQPDKPPMALLRNARRYH